MIKKVFFPLLVCWLLLAPSGWALSQGPVLLSMSKTETSDQARIQIGLSAALAPRTVVSGQRVDLILPAAAVGSALKTLPEDASLIKVMLIQQRDDLVVSFLFRRPPVAVEADYSPARDQVDLNVFWSQESARQRLAIMPAIKGVATARAGGATSTKTRSSRFTGNWREFFAAYETPFAFALPPRFSLPPLPLLPLARAAAAEDQGLNLLAPALKQVERGDWEKALQELQVHLQAPLEEQAREAFLVLYGEAQIRNGFLTQAGSTLDGFCSKYPASPYGARGRYLLAYARAVSGDPFAAIYHLEQARADLAPADPLQELVLLLYGEASLAKQDFAAALEVLSGPDFDDRTNDLRLLARGCALSGVGRHGEAVQLFAGLEERYGELRDPYALEHYARSLYRSGAYAAAQQAYRRLAELCAGHPDEGLAYFAQVQAALRQDDLQGARNLLDRILVAFPESAGGQRAALKQIDLAVLDGPEKVLVWAVIDYGRYAEEVSERELREEAGFKRALALHLKGENVRSVDALQQFIRDFFSGTLRREAEALLGELLPGVVDQLIAQGEHMQALVMVERNREILLDRRISWEFLARLAGAFSDMELLQRAARVYLFMLDNNQDLRREEPLYRPLLRTLYQSGQYRLVEEYAERYQRNHPQGHDRAAVTLLRAQALNELGRKPEAAALLVAAGRPAGRELDAWGGRLCFEIGDYAAAAGCLVRLTERGDGDPTPQELILLAEALFRAERPEEALPYFEALQNDAGVADQAIYRSAQIYLQNGRQAGALKLLNRLADEGESPLWRKMAREMLGFLQL